MKQNIENQDQEVAALDRFAEVLILIAISLQEQK
jgi:hypothetical protein